jgi:hypothetical protein
MQQARRGRPYDLATRHKGMRYNNEWGIRVYIPVEVLERAGVGEADADVYYRIWGGRRGSLLVTLYREP